MFGVKSNLSKNSILSVIVAATLIGSFILPYSFSSNNNSKLFVLAQAPTTAPATDNKPNIPMIVGDDMGYSDIGAFGSEISTPNLDALAREGKILTNYHTVPVCSLARVAMLTGVDHHIGGLGYMYELIAQNQIGKPGYETWINNRVVTVADLLKDAGYHTYMSGKWHLSGNHFENGTFPHDRGFERDLTLLNGGANHFNVYPEPPIEKITFAENGKIIPRPGNKTLFSNELYADRMIEYIKNTTDGKPFFAYLAFQVAHSPFQTPQEDIAKYDKIYSVGWDKIREQRFEKQKELGIWNADMRLPDRIPPNQPWAELSAEQQAYASRILGVRAVMIENMDENIGRVIQMLKDSGQYDNTLIMFAADNGTSEAGPLLGIKFSSLPNPEVMEEFVKGVNNTLSNLGNGTAQFNYAAWGADSSAAPLSGYKATEYEGGTRVSFMVKEPGVASSASGSAPGSNTANPKIIKAFAYVNDITPTILEYAGVQHPNTYQGREVHPLIGKSLKALFNGTADRVYGENDTVADEMFNMAAVYMGDWKAIKHEPPIGDGKWQLINLVDNPTETINVADQHPDMMQKLIAAYGAYAKDVGVVIPRGQAYYESQASGTPPVNQTQVTITSIDIRPENFTNAANTSIAQQGGGPPAEQQQQQQQTASSPTTGEMADIMLGGMSTDGSVEVTVNWTVADIGQPNTFSFMFADPDGNPISPIYSIQLLQNKQTVPGTLRQEQTSLVQEYTFNQTGSYTMHIHDMQDRRAIAMINIPLQVNATTPGSNP